MLHSIKFNLKTEETNFMNNFDVKWFWQGSSIAFGTYYEQTHTELVIPKESKNPMT